MNELWVQGKKFGSNTEEAEINCADYGILCYDMTTTQLPARDVEMISVPGRNGDLTLDNGRWKNIDLEYWLMAVPGIVGGNLLSGKEKIDRFINELASYGGYMRLRSGGEPNHYRYGVFRGGVPVEYSQIQDLHRGVACKVKLVFSAKPQKYLLDGLELIRVPGNGTASVTNATNMTALPEVWFYGPGKVRIGNSELTFDPEDSGMTRAVVDTELRYARGWGSDVGWMDATAQIFSSTSTWVPIPPGTMTVWNTTSETAILKPRWWTL